MNGFEVSSDSSRTSAGSIPALAPPAYSVVPCSRTACAARAASSTLASVFLPLTSFSRRGIAFSRVCRSARISSVWIVSMSDDGSTLPSTCTTSGSPKARITWQIASASRMLARNLLPSPSPSLAPRTMPAMSTNDTVAGRIRALPKTSASFGQPLVRQRDHPDVGLDRRERVVRGEHLVLGEGVEQGGLADVGQSDDSDGEGHEDESLPAVNGHHELAARRPRRRRPRWSSGPPRSGPRRRTSPGRRPGRRAGPRRTRRPGGRRAPAPPRAPRRRPARCRRRGRPSRCPGAATRSKPPPASSARSSRSPTAHRTSTPAASASARASRPSTRRRPARSPRGRGAPARSRPGRCRCRRPARAAAAPRVGQQHVQEPRLAVQVGTGGGQLAEPGGVRRPAPSAGLGDPSGLRSGHEDQPRQSGRTGAGRSRQVESPCPTGRRAPARPARR